MDVFIYGPSTGSKLELENFMRIIVEVPFFEFIGEEVQINEDGCAFLSSWMSAKKESGLGFRASGISHSGVISSVGQTSEFNAWLPVEILPFWGKYVSFPYFCERFCQEFVDGR